MKHYTTPHILVIATNGDDVIATSGISTNKGSVLDPEQLKDAVEF